MDTGPVLDSFLLKKYLIGRLKEGAVKWDKISWIWMIFLFVALVGCGGPEVKKAKYTTRAQQYIQEENWPKARVALRNVLKIDPNDAEANYLVGLVEEKEKNWLNAFRYYLKVVDLNPNHRGVLVKLGRFYLEGGVPDRAAEIADRILAAHPGDPAAEVLQAGVRIKKGEKGAAVAQLERVVRNHPGEPDPVSLLAALYIDENRLAEAEKIFRQSVEKNPTNVVLLNNLGNTLVRLGRSEETEEILHRIIEMEPKVFHHRLRLAAFYRSRNDLDKAEFQLKEAIKLDPESEERRLALAEFMETSRGLKEGEEALLEAKRILSQSMKLRFALGRFYEKRGEPTKARNVYQEVIDQEGKRPAGLDAKVKLATLDLAEGNKEDAQRRLSEVLKENPRASEALLLRGRMGLAQGEHKEAVQAFRSVLKDQPERSNVHALLGEAYFLQGETTLARESLEKAVLLNPQEVGAARRLAQLDGIEGRRKEARRRLESIVAKRPDDLESLQLLIHAQLADHDFHAAESTLAKMRAETAHPFIIGMAEGEFHQAKKNWGPAIAAFERAAASRPDSPDPLFSLVRIELSQGKADETLRRLQKVIEAQPEHPFAHGMLGEVLLTKGKFEEAEAAFEIANRIKPDWVAPWLNRASLKRAQKNLPGAISLLETGQKANPKATELRLLLASLLSGTGEVDRAIELYESVLKDQPKSVVAANNLAVLLADKKGDPKSLERALALSRDFETYASNNELLDTRGWIYVKTGQPKEAVRLLRQVVEKAPDHPVFQYHLGVAYYKAGEAKRAKEALARAVQSGKPFPGLEEAKSILAETKG
jgi:tetratricopeptide (TPR) repeat protein